jgi:hypothetical protein
MKAQRRGVQPFSLLLKLPLRRRYGPLGKGEYGVGQQKVRRGPPQATTTFNRKGVMNI